MNRPLVDIREYFEKDGVLRPGLKGLSLRRSEWNKLKENIELVDEKLESLMKQRGSFWATVVKDHDIMKCCSAISAFCYKFVV